MHKKTILKLKSYILLIVLHLFLLVNSKVVKNVGEKPNIVVIMADDLGSFDVSLKGGNQILTPNIDALGYQGVILNRHYTPPLCSPSRAAFLTGKSPINLGMQFIVIFNDEPRSLSLDEKLLPEYLKEVGYRTHIVGKWHLGFARKSFLPTHRGFDTHVGFLGSHIDYFNFTNTLDPYPAGFDFRYNEEVYRDRIGEYATDVLTDEATKIIEQHNAKDGPLFMYFPHIAVHSGNEYDPLQAVPEDLETVAHIKDPDRRTYAAMVKALDRSVGKVVTALKEKDMLENTIILFFSDNGGPTQGYHATSASNFPLRGQKDGPWEGGVRGTAVIWSPLLQKRHHVSNHLVHITDWMPTFAELAKVSSYKEKDLNGNNIWSTISYNKSPLRREIVHNIDTISGYTSYYKDGWKYINGTRWNGAYDQWIGKMAFEESPEASSYPNLVMKSKVWEALNPYALKNLTPDDLNEMRKKTGINCRNVSPPSRDCKPLEAPCLFYVDDDPCEMNNLAHFRPTRMAIIEKRLQYLQETMTPPGNLPRNSAANPALHDGIWTWWFELMQE